MKKLADCVVKDLSCRTDGHWPPDKMSRILKMAFLAMSTTGAKAMIISAI